MKNKAMLLIIILAVVAVVLAVMIILQQKTPQESAVTKEPTPKTLYLKDQDVLVFPDPDAPQQERDRHSALVDKLAQNAPYLDLTGCKPDPLVLAVRQEEDLIIKNRDTKKGYVFFWGNTTIDLPAGKSITVTAQELGAGVGNLGYACYESGTTPSGIGTIGVIRTRATE